MLMQPVYDYLLMLYSASTEGLQQHVLHGELTLELKPKDK